MSAIRDIIVRPHPGRGDCGRVRVTLGNDDGRGCRGVVLEQGPYLVYGVAVGDVCDTARHVCVVVPVARGSFTLKKKTYREF
jgi:hypothetical protein